MGKGECGMYLLGTFVVDAIPDDEDDLDFFTFPELDSLDRRRRPRRPDRRLLPGRQRARTQDGGKEMLKYLGTAEAADAANDRHRRPFIAANDGADTSVYTALQKKSAEVVGAAANIAQFLDRDTRSDFASTVMIPSLQKFLEGPRRHRRRLTSIQEQKESIFV